MSLIMGTVIASSEHWLFASFKHICWGMQGNRKAVEEKPTTPISIPIGQKGKFPTGRYVACLYM